MQHQVLLLSATIGAAALPFLPRVVDTELHGVFLGLAALYFVLAWHYFEQDFLIAHIATYVERILQPRLSLDSSSRGLNWERFRNELVFRTCLRAMFYTALTLFRLLPTVGLGLVFMGSFWFLKSSGRGTSWAAWEIGAFAANVILAIFMIIVGVTAYFSYLRITEAKE